MTKKVLDTEPELCYAIPVSLPICGIEVPVEVLPGLENDGEFHQADMETGESPRIHICPKVHPSCQERVLLHEAVHGILRSTGLVHMLGEQMEEAVCEALDTHLPEVLRRLEEGRGRKTRPRRTKGQNP